MIPNLYPANAVLPRFPIRCDWAPRDHDGPAVVALVPSRPCGCPDERLAAPAYTCESCAVAYPVGSVADNPSRCSVCGVVSRVTIAASRPLNEGDLP